MCVSLCETRHLHPSPALLRLLLLLLLFLVLPLVLILLSDSFSCTRNVMRTFSVSVLHEKRAMHADNGVCVCQVQAIDTSVLQDLRQRHTSTCGHLVTTSALLRLTSSPDTRSAATHQPMLILVPVPPSPVKRQPPPPPPTPQPKILGVQTVRTPTPTPQPKILGVQTVRTPTPTTQPKILGAQTARRAPASAGPGRKTANSARNKRPQTAHATLGRPVNTGQFLFCI